MLKRTDASDNTNLSVISNEKMGEIAEKVILNGDLSALSSKEKFQYVSQLCNSLDLNILTKPIQLIKFQGKEVIYFTKDATEQIRVKSRISITSTDSKVVNGVYMVSVFGCTQDGRIDSATGAVSIDGLKGDALANAMMKAETKAKRRFTLSICGLGVLDESEIDSIQGAVRVDAYVQKDDATLLEHDPVDKFEEFKFKLEASSTLTDLKNTYNEAQKFNWGNFKIKYFNELIKIKDQAKSDIEKELNQDVNM